MPRPLAAAALLACALLAPCLRADSGPDADVRAAGDLARRILPRHHAQIVFARIPDAGGQDVFELSDEGGRVRIGGNSPLSMSFGLGWYLERHAHAQVSINGRQLELPAQLPPVGSPVRLEAWARYRYLLNYCTFGYVTPWWDWEEWEPFIDWMALSGINAPLAVTGQEAVWQAVGRRFGMTEEEITAFLPAAPYLPFCWMGCLDGYGGPLPEGWIERRAALERRILARERELGMTPVLQGFTGHIPEALARRHPEARTQRIHWVEWETTMLDPTDPLFGQIAEAFLAEQTRLFGSDHLYAADSFIEMTPPSGELDYLADLGRAIYDGMARYDPEAVWLLQGWTFMNQGVFWTEDRVRAFLGAVPNERMLLLDLYCDGYPVWSATDGFHGKPWVWSFISNFGGQVFLGSSGPVDRFADLAAVRRDPLASGLSGVGYMMEGFGNNPPLFDLMFELAWDSDIDVDEWFGDYPTARYGARSEAATRAWEILRQRVYSRGWGRQSVVAAYPSDGLDHSAYSLSALAEAWRLLLEAEPTVGRSATWEHDVVNVARQALATYAGTIHEEAVSAFARGDADAHREASRRFLGLIADIDELLGSNEQFLLGRWLADARQWGGSGAERAHLEYNARRILSLWGDTAWLRDYACREWSGMLRSFCGRRWEIYLDRQQAALRSGEPFDRAACDAELLAFENAWSRGREACPEQPRGDAGALATRLYAKYIASRPSVGSLATRKPVTCSHSLPGMGPELANDGWIEREGFWAMDVAQQGEDAWWQVDLGAATTVGRVVVVGYWGDGRSYGFTVEASLDGVEWETVADRRDSAETSTREGETCRFTPRPARFLRVTQTRNSANTGRHLVEVMAYPE